MNPPHALLRSVHRTGPVALALLFSPLSLFAEFDREAVLYGIDSRQFQLMSEQAALSQLSNRQALLDAHVPKKAVADTAFAAALTGLDDYHAQLTAVDGQNKWKTALKMMIKTGKGIHDTVNLAKTGTSNLINHGMTTAVGEFAWDQMKSSVEGDLKKKIGVDIDSLSAHQTKKVAACTQLAATKLKELHGVRRAIAMSLDDVKAIIENETGTAIQSDDVAVLRRNRILREQIVKAKTAIAAVQTSSTEAAEDLPENKALLQADIKAAEARINRLNEEITALRAELRAGDLAALLAAAEEQIEDPVDLPGPNVSVPADPPDDHAARLAAARRAAVIATWEAQSPSLINTIETHKSSINHLWNNLQGRYADNVVPEDPAGFIESMLGVAPPAPSIYADVAGLAGSLSTSQGTLEGVTEAMEEVPDLLIFCGDLQEAFIDLSNTRNELVSLENLVKSVPGAWAGLSSGTAYDGPETCSLTAVDALASFLMELTALFPLAQTNAEETSAGMTEAFGIVNAAATAFTTEIRAELSAAEAAMNQMASAARAYQNLLNSIPELAPHHNPGFPTSYYGVWTEMPDGSTDGYVRVLNRIYHRRLYSRELARKIRDEGYTAAAAYKAKLDRMAATAEKIRDRYAAASQRFSTAYEQLEISANHHGIALFHNISSIGSPPAGAGSLPSVSGDNARFLKLRSGFNTTVSTDLNGGSYEPGEDYATNYGLQKLSELPEIVTDTEDRTLFVHTILEQMQAIAEHGHSDWLSMPIVEFQNMFWPRHNALGDLARNLQTELGKDIGFLFLQQEDIDLVNGAITVISNDLMDAYNRYIDQAKPALSNYTESANVAAKAGEFAHVVLSVRATGDDLEYQWYRSIYTFPGPGYTNYSPLPGEQSPTLSITLDKRRDFYCLVKNTAGKVLTNPIPVEFQIIANPLSWVGVDTQDAQVAVPFEWALKTSPMASSWEIRGLPTGFSINASTGVLSGIPTTAGTLSLLVEASLGDRFISKAIDLEIASPPPIAEVMDSWLGGFFNDTELNDPSISDPDACPAGDGVSNRLKFALGLNPTTPTLPQEVLTLTLPATGNPEIQFQIGKPANALGLRAHLYQAVSLLGPWWPVSEVLENDQGSWIGVRASVSTSHDHYFKIVLEEPE